MIGSHSDWARIRRWAGDGNDTITGFDNASILNSGTGYPFDGYGADLIDGGAGDDFLTGGDLRTVGAGG